MPSLRQKNTGPSVSQAILTLPGDMPGLPEDVLERFPSLASWKDSTQQWWRQAQAGLNDASNAVLDRIALTGVLKVNPEAGSIFIKESKGYGKWADPDTPFYVDRLGFFSLKNKLTWNPETSELIVVGDVDFDSGTIGGFDIGANFISDTANSMGLSSEVTGGDDVRFWAGDTFANRATAPFRVYESGALFASNATISGSITVTSGTFGGWTIGATTISANNAVLDSAGQLVLGTANDVVVLSATDATYRVWAGNATAGSATFQVTKTGVLSATNAVISGTITASTVIIGYTSQYTVSTSSNFQVINTSGQANLVQNFCFGSGTPNFEGWVAGGTIGTPSNTQSGRLMKLKLVTYGDTGWINGGNASIWLRTTQIHTNTARGTEIEFRTTPNGSISEQVVLQLRQDASAVFNGAVSASSVSATTISGTLSGSGASITSISASNISSGTLDSARMPASFGGTFTGSINSTYLKTNGTSADVTDGNFRVLNGGSQTARIDYTTGFYYVQGNKVVGARGTRGAAGLTQVVALLDDWQAWG